MPQSLLQERLLNRRIEPRVGQIDASILDSELLSMLKNQLWQGFKHFRPDIKDKYESELLLLLKLALFKLTVWDHSATYGAKLQSLTFVDARSRVTNRPISVYQKLGYGVLVVGGSYIWEKLDEYLTRASYTADETNSGRIEKLRSLSDRLASLWSISTLANFVLFLYSGKYSTLILRILKIRLAPTTRKVSRQVNFEFQNRQLVWNAFTEFLLFILPLLNVSRIKRTLSKYFTKSDASKSESGELSFLPEKTCAICYKEDEGIVANKDVTNPYKSTSCGHTYCYVCIKSKILESEGEGWDCLRCGKFVQSIEPYVDVNPKAIVVKDIPQDEVEEESSKQMEKEKESETEKQPEKTTNSKENREQPEQESEPSETESESESDSDSGNPGSGFIVDDDF